MYSDGVDIEFDPAKEAFGETNLGTPATGTCQAGSTTTTIKLAAGASAVDNAYRGMRISLTGGTGSGQEGYVVSYVGSTKVATVMDTWTATPDATTTYSIAAQTVYAPVSSAMESLTHYVDLDGLQHKMIFSRGACSLKLSPKALPMLSFEFLSMYTTPTDLALPSGAVLTGFKSPLPILNSYTSGFKLLGFAGNLYDLSLNVGQKTIHRDDVVGVDDVLITDRSPSGSVTIQAPLMAEKDYFTPARDATLGSLWLTVQRHPRDEAGIQGAAVRHRGHHLQRFRPVSDRRKVP